MTFFPVNGFKVAVNRGGGACPTKALYPLSRKLYYLPGNTPLVWIFSHPPQRFAFQFAPWPEEWYTWLGTLDGIIAFVNVYVITDEYAEKKIEPNSGNNKIKRIVINHLEYAFYIYWLKHFSIPLHSGSVSLQLTESLNQWVYNLRALQSGYTRQEILTFINFITIFFISHRRSGIRTWRMHV